MLMFMEKPSKKLYPDYYQVIAEPIDMLAIEANIKAEKYQSENELIQDFKVYFVHCYNKKTTHCILYITDLMYFTLYCITVSFCLVNV